MGPGGAAACWLLSGGDRDGLGAVGQHPTHHLPNPLHLSRQIHQPTALQNEQIRTGRKQGHCHPQAMAGTQLLTSLRTGQTVSQRAQCPPELVRAQDPSRCHPSLLCPRGPPAERSLTTGLSAGTVFWAGCSFGVTGAGSLPGSGCQAANQSSGAGRAPETGVQRGEAEVYVPTRKLAPEHKAPSSFWFLTRVLAAGSPVLEGSSCRDAAPV